MSAFERIRPALLYIDDHLDASLRIEDVAAIFHFSPYYFHRMFTLIVGRSMAAYIRERRLVKACRLLHETGLPMVEIALHCGFETSQAFSRAFRRAYGLPPGAYRREGCIPPDETAEALVMRFTNRLRGGILVNPKIIKKEKIRIAGNIGPGEQTAEVWQAFEDRAAAVQQYKGVGGYEVRLFSPESHRVHVGYDIGKAAAPEGFDLMELPAGEYAVFEVYVSQGYTSENSAMETWLADNSQGYSERLLDGVTHFVVEFYDDRFKGEESGSIVEIWVPIQKQ